MIPSQNPAKRAVRQQAAAAINAESRATTGFFALPYRLPGLIAFLPTYLAARLARGHVSHVIEIAILLVVFGGVQLLLGLYFRGFLRRHPDLKWQLLIR